MDGEITGRRSPEKFWTLLEFTPEAMAVINKEGKIIFVNSPMVKLFGYSQQEFIGQTVEMIQDEPDFTVCGEAADGYQGLKLIKGKRHEIE